MRAYYLSNRVAKGDWAVRPGSPNAAPRRAAPLNIHPPFGPTRPFRARTTITSIAAPWPPSPVVRRPGPTTFRDYGAPICISAEATKHRTAPRLCAAGMAVASVRSANFLSREECAAGTLLADQRLLRADVPYPTLSSFFTNYE